MSSMPRPYGTGRVYKRGDRWHLEYSVNGERVRKSCGSAIKTKKEAQAMLRDLQSAADRGFTPSKALVSDLLDLYIEEHKRLGKKDQGVYAKLEVLRAGLGKYKACELTVKHIERWQRWMRESRGVGGRVKRLESYDQIRARLAIVESDNAHLRRCLRVFAGKTDGEVGR